MVPGKRSLLPQLYVLAAEQFRRLMDGFAIEGTIKEVFTKQPNLENSIVQGE